jgi:hypothetical protein
MSELSAGIFCSSAPIIGALFKSNDLKESRSSAARCRRSGFVFGNAARIHPTSSFSEHIRFEHHKHCLEHEAGSDVELGDVHKYTSADRLYITDI